MKKNILILYDSETEYTTLMGEYLGKQKNIPWDIHCYTEIGNLLEHETNPVSMLVVAEGSFSEELQKLSAEKTVLLNESGLVKWGQYPNINKYQKAEAVLRELLEIYAEIATMPLIHLKNNARTVFWGFYSPIRRCLQTSLSLTLAHLLARSHSVLFLSLEQFSGVGDGLENDRGRDLTDVLYFLGTDTEKFPLRLQSMIHHREGVDYLPTIRYGQNLLTVSPGEWLLLMEKIGDLKEYDYVLMDLSEGVQGLADILRACATVFCITKNDRISRGKLYQYEKFLTTCSYEDVLEKTVRCNIPNIKRLPDEMDQIGRGELAEYAEKLLEDVGGRDGL